MRDKTADGRGFPQWDATGQGVTGKCPYEHGFELADERDGTNRYRIVLLHDGKMPVVLATCTDEHGRDVHEPKVEQATDAFWDLLLTMTYAQKVLGVRFPHRQAMVDAIAAVSERRG